MIPIPTPQHRAWASSTSPYLSIPPNPPRLLVAPWLYFCCTPTPDPRAGEIICRTCAVVIGERCIDDGAEWRTFVDDSSNGRADPNRCGERLSVIREALILRQVFSPIIDAKSLDYGSQYSRPTCEHLLCLLH